MTEYRHKIEEKNEGSAKWNKENIYSETIVKGGKPGLKSTICNRRINIQPEQNEETRIQKNEERLRNLRDNFKHSNIRIIGVPEGEEEEQEIENLFET